MIQIDEDPIIGGIYLSGRDVPEITVAKAREWLEYMQTIGESSQVDVFGGVAIGVITLHELRWFFPDIDAQDMESWPLNDLVDLAEALMEYNTGFAALRKRLVDAGEQVLRNVSPGGTD